MLTFRMVPANDGSPDTDTDYTEQYILNIADGDKNALAELYNKTRVPVYSFALSMLKNPDDAQDILHDCFLQIWQAAGSYKRMGKPMAWIMTITKNLCLMKIREYSKAGEEPPEYNEAYFQSNDNMSAEDKAILNECMSKLSDDERQIVVLHAVSGFKHREIADILNKPLSTVLSKYNRAIGKMRKMIEGERLYV